jgi:type IV secretory pathway VirB3-like protein
MFLKLYCSHPPKTLGVTYNTKLVSTMLITLTFHKQLFLMLLAYLTLVAYIIWPDNAAERMWKDTVKALFQ